MTPLEPSAARSRTQWFLASYYWLVLRNLIGCVLILLSIVAGPFVPGPGGIPLFLIGFALVTFPGKRRLTARVLRGGRVRLRGRRLTRVIAVAALVVPGVLLWLGRRLGFLPAWCGASPVRAVAAYLAGVLLTALLSYAAVLLVNLLLRAMPPIRRWVRPWLRKHRIRLLPPRRRSRLPHEPGTGPLRLKDEILSLLKRH